MKYIRAYTYSTHDDTYQGTLRAVNMQRSYQWLALTLLFYKLGITILY